MHPIDRSIEEGGGYFFGSHTVVPAPTDVAPTDRPTSPTSPTTRVPARDELVSGFEFLSSNDDADRPREDFISFHFISSVPFRLHPPTQNPVPRSGKVATPSSFIVRPRTHPSIHRVPLQRQSTHRSRRDGTGTGDGRGWIVGFVETKWNHRRGRDAVVVDDVDTGGACERRYESSR